ncbi:MAG TPA: pilus assembly protein [Pseudolabrys sp.]|nr:pilus assembly protein [Pseudolabrys sp.]
MAPQGNVAITFALSSLVVVGGVGASIDYSRANSAKAALQAALDSAVLSLSREAATDTTAQLQANASSYLLANFNRPGTTNITVTPVYTTSGGSQIVATAQASVPTTVAAVLGVNAITVSATSTVKWGNSRLRVALVLDNTGSMAQSGKISALQTATKNLLTQLQAAATNNGDVYVSIVPFVKDVNVGASNYKANWIDWTDWNAANGSCSSYYYSTQSACVAAHKTWTAANHNTWNGCVADRGGSSAPDTANYDTNVVAPSTTIKATLFPAEQYSACPAAAMGLSYDWASMTALVNNMSPNGNTNQAIGLALGWMSLTGGGPFTAPAMDSNYTYNQIIILLTDGLNTQDRWYSDQASIDARQTLTCSNIKAAGITLYTVEVSTDGTPVSSLLQQCASDSSKFFYLTSADEIVATFSAIGTNLSNLFVAN